MAQPKSLALNNKELPGIPVMSSCPTNFANYCPPNSLTFSSDGSSPIVGPKNLSRIEKHGVDAQRHTAKGGLLSTNHSSGIRALGVWTSAWPELAHAEWRRSLAGLSLQVFGVRPCLIAFFSSSLLCWRGAAIRLASTICPDMAM